MLSVDERKKVLEAKAKAKAEKAKMGSDNNTKRFSAAVNSNENNSTGSNESELLVHAGNIADVLRQKNIQPAYTVDAGDHITSRRQQHNKTARINIIRWLGST